jgi:hypothetical protein
MGKIDKEGSEVRSRAQALPLPHIGQALRRARLYQGKSRQTVGARLRFKDCHNVTLLERQPNVGMHLILRFLDAIEMDPKRLFDFIEPSH